MSTCQQCGGAAADCELPDSTRMFKQMAREYYATHVIHEGNVDPINLARRLRQVDDDRTKKIVELITRRIELWRTVVARGAPDFAELAKIRIEELEDVCQSIAKGKTT